MPRGAGLSCPLKPCPRCRFLRKPNVAVGGGSSHSWATREICAARTDCMWGWGPAALLTAPQCGSAPSGVRVGHPTTATLTSGTALRWLASQRVWAWAAALCCPPPPGGASSAPRICVPLAGASVLVLGPRVSRGRGPPGLQAPPPEEERGRPVRKCLDHAPGFEPRQALHGSAGQL